MFQGGVVAGTAEGVFDVFGAEEVPDGGVSDGVGVGAGAGVLGDAGGDFGAFRELGCGVVDGCGGFLGDEPLGVAGGAFRPALDQLDAVVLAA